MKRAILQKMTWLILAVAMAAALGGAAMASDAYQDHYYNRYSDSGRSRDPLRMAYDNGYRDGLQRGHYDSRERFRYNIHSQLYNDGRDGYDRWMGHFGDYKRAFRDGYARGYSEGYDKRWGNGWR
jgi:hypothetical protein